MNSILKILLCNCSLLINSTFSLKFFTLFQIMNFMYTYCAVDAILSAFFKVF